ncbi:hypothetical protein L218DRAFT_557369 [Marasmius fiardii PR-910]|nr:hypothetical protein L218DRAFT_557369 [Marasmius fiardii PR-910]
MKKAAKKAVAKKPAAVKKPAAKKPVAPKKPAAPAKKPAAPAKKPTTVAKKPATTKKAAAKPTTTKKTAAAKPTTTKKATTAAKATAAKKPVTSAKKPAASTAAKKPAVNNGAKAATTAKKPATTAKAATAAKKPATTAKAATAAKKPTTTAKVASAAKKPATTAKGATASKKPATPAKKPTSAASKKPATPAKKSASAKKPAGTAKPVNNAGKKPANSTTGATKKPVKPATNSTAKACPLPKTAAAKPKTSTATKVKAKAREFIEAVVRLYRRDTFEFVGFHGTNGENGNIYMNAAKTKGTIVAPFKFNGNDGELGGGLYITDDFTTAQSFAGSSASNRKNQATKKGCPLQPTDDASKAVVCKVEAKSSSKFRESVAKIWIPPDEIATSIGGVNDPTKLAAQASRIKGAGANPSTALRFSVLKKNDPKNPKIGNQIMLPPGAFGDFVIRQCVPVNAGKPSGTKEFPAFNFRNQDFDWNIAGDPFGELSPNEEGDITDAKKPRE